jgi:gamma-glutamyl:cysteine ligase YbdK (ATP-grasp superfamily)
VARRERGEGRGERGGGGVHADGIAKQVANASEGLLGGIREGLGAEIRASAENAALEDDVEELVDAVVDEAVADGAERKLEGLQNKAVNT